MLKTIRQFVLLLAMLATGGVAIVLVLIYSGEPLDDIEGRPAQSAGAGPTDLFERAEQTLAAGEIFECGEAELNAHIASVLQAREAGGFEMFAEFKGLWVRLEKDALEVIFERDVLGLPSTVSARIEVISRDGGHAIAVTGGRFGQLPVPAGALILIQAGLQNAGGVFAGEKVVLSRTAHLKVSPGRLRFEPPSPGG